MPYSSTGRGDKLPVRFHSASGRQPRSFGETSVPQKKAILTLVWGPVGKQKKTVKTASGRRMERRKGAGVAIVHPSKLIPIKARAMLLKIQAG
jgi:hypothetical protein